MSPGNGLVVASKIGADPDPQGKIQLKLAQRPAQLRASVEDNLVSWAWSKSPWSICVVPMLARYCRRERSARRYRRPNGGDDRLTRRRQDRRHRAERRQLGWAQPRVCCRYSLRSECLCLVSRQFEDVLMFCLANKIAWVRFFPLGGAVAGWPKVIDQPKVIAIAARMNITPLQVGLVWLLRHTPNTLLIPGTGSTKHLEENIAAAAVVLDEDAMAELNALEADNIDNQPQSALPTH